MFLTDGVTGSQIKTEYALIAQSVEHAAVNRGVVGSSPTGGAMKCRHTFGVAAFPLLKNLGNGPLAQLVRAAGS